MLRRNEIFMKICGNFTKMKFAQAINYKKICESLRKILINFENVGRMLGKVFRKFWINYECE